MNSNVEHPVVAFLGLGHMGMPMAGNLVAAGHRVQGFDPVPAALEAATERGVEAASTVVEALRGADVVISMLPSGGHVQDLYQGAGGLLANAESGALLIDCSTIDVPTARAVNEAANASGRDAVDAPVSGGVPGAEAATLTFMVGGGDDAFRRAEPILAEMGRLVVHCGESGAGQAAKVCNNMILGISMIGVSEAFVLAEALGLSHEALFEVASQSSGQCWSLSSYCPVPGPVPASPANNDYRAGFSAGLMLKDLTLAHGIAEESGVASELGAAAFDLYSRYVEEVDATSDFSGIVRWIRDRSRTGDEGQAS